MVGVAPDMFGVALDGSLLLLSSNVNMDVSYLFLPKMPVLFPAFFFLFLLTMNFNSTILCLKYIICIPMLSKNFFIRAP